MKAGWPKKSLGEICGFVRGPFGGSLKKSVFVADGFAVYEQQHAIYDQFDDIRYFIDDAKFREMQRFELRPNDLIMSCSGTMGKVAIVPDNIRRGIINQALLKLTPTKTVSPEFLKYWMDSTDFQDSLKEQSGGAAIQNVASVSILKEIQISLPPLTEQQRIVGLLDEAFEGLATAKANAEKNLQNARALFESHLQSVFTQRGPGWVEKLLGEALVKTETTDPTRSPQTEFDYIDVSSVSKETLAIQETQRLQGKDAPSRARKLVRTNDVIFATIRPTLRRIAIVPDELDSQVCSTGYFVLRAKPDMDHRLVFYFLQTETFMTAMETLQKGASYPAVTDGDVRLQTIPIPPLNEQKTIAAKLESLREETQRLTRLYEQKHVALEALKKSLLHQAFTGEL